MTKLLLGISIVAFTSYCGYVLAKKYRRRKLFFGEWKEFNERFITEISYYRRPLGEFFAKFTYKGEFQKFLESYFEWLNFGSGRISELLEIPFCSFLTKEEKNILVDYFQMLGKGDSNSQKAYFSSVKETLAKLCANAESSHKKYGDLYIKLGFLSGLLILILII